jgi:MFS family permease
VKAASFQAEFKFDKEDVDWILGSFFAAYAIGQLLAGWLADRFGTRLLMACFIALWSFFTLMTGLATGFWTLLAFRIGCGLAEAGAYPASSRMVSRWIPLRSRGWSSSLVAGGGRLGGALAPKLTGLIILSLMTWRSPGWIFGGCGILFALVFWILMRDRPRDHPAVNAAELQLITRGLPPEQANAPATTRRFPLGGLIRNRSMWVMSLHQFLANLGWAFLATRMPTFFQDAKGVSEGDSGSMATVALTIGITGMFVGGWITDFLSRRLGLRRGRMIPLAWTRFVAAAAYLLCLLPVSPWFCVAMFAIVAMMSDIAVPATWAYCQDVGGRNVAAVLAWPNMWGNLGAAITPWTLSWVNSHFDTQKNWHPALIVMAAAFIACGISAFGVRADEKIAGTDGDEQAPPGFPVILPVATEPTPSARI